VLNGRSDITIEKYPLMKILYVDFYYEYGNPSRGLNYIGVNGFENALRYLGHDVHHFYLDEHLKDKKKLNRNLLDCAANLMPELVFFNLYNNIVEVETIKEMSKTAITVNWFGDDPFLFEHFTKRYAPFFSYCVTTDKYSINKYKSIGQENVIFSQWPAHQFDQARIERLDYKYDVSFVGAKNPPREWFVNELRNKGIEVEVFGNGWPNGPITNDEMCAIFEQSKINLNISNSDIWDYRFLFSGYCGFKVLIRSLFKYHIKKSKMMSKMIQVIKNDGIPPITFYGKTSSQIKARNFEIPSCRGFQLTDYVPSIEDYFVLGKEIACYSNLDEAEKLIRYYLSQDETREAIKLAGFKRAGSEYTYKNTLLKVLNIIELFEKSVH
jgi:spore maturation protein CgeB